MAIKDLCVASSSSSHSPFQHGMLFVIRRLCPASRQHQQYTLILHITRPLTCSQFKQHQHPQHRTFLINQQNMGRTARKNKSVKSETSVDVMQITTTTDGGSTTTTTIEQQQVTTTTDDNTEKVEVVTAAVTKTKKKRKSLTADANADASSSSSSSARTVSDKKPKKKQKRKKKKEQAAEEDEGYEEEAEEAEDEEEEYVSEKKKKPRGKKKKQEDEDAEADAKPSATNKRGTPAAPLPPPPPLSFRRTVPNGVTIISWNVAGFRNANKHGASEYLKKSNADIICLNEVRADEAIVTKNNLALDNYHCYWHAPKVKKGYSGVCILSRIQPLSVKYGLYDATGTLTDIDDEGRVITAEYSDFFLVNSYVPNSQIALKRLPYRTGIWDSALRTHLLSLTQLYHKPIIWTGDLNVAHQPIDLHAPTRNKKSAGFTIEERDSFTKTLQSHTPPLVDVYRHFFPNDHDGCYTYWSYRFAGRAKNHGWRIDYFIVSDELKDRLVDMYVGSEVNQQGTRSSDHAPIWLHMRPH